MSRVVAPNRKIASPAADAWAQPGSQAVPSADTVARIVCTGQPLRWRAIPYTGVGPGATVVTGNATTVDMVVARIVTDEFGNESLARGATLGETSGGEVRVGKQITEDDVSPGDTVIIGIVAVTLDGSPALHIIVEDGQQPL